MKNDKV